MPDPVLIDSHMHIFETKEEGRKSKEGYQLWEYGERNGVHSGRYVGTIDDAITALKTAGFAKAVVVNIFATVQARREPIAKLSRNMKSDDRKHAIAEVDALMIDKLKNFNKWGCDLARTHNQLVPYVTMDPWGLPGEAGASHLRDLVENRGAKGIKVHPVGQEFHMSDPRMMPIYKTALELGLPIIAHAGPSRDGNSYGEPRAFGEVLKSFPDLTVVLAHLGGGSWQQSLEIAMTYPNAYFDCCEIIEWTGGSEAPSDLQLARLIKDIGTDRVLMGSDFPWYDLDHTVERVMELPLLTRDEKEGILGMNAIRTLCLED